MRYAIFGHVYMPPSVVVIPDTDVLSVHKRERQSIRHVRGLHAAFFHFLFAFQLYFPQRGELLIDGNQLINQLPLEFR